MDLNFQIIVKKSIFSGLLPFQMLVTMMQV